MEEERRQKEEDGMVAAADRWRQSRRAGWVRRAVCLFYDYKMNLLD